MYCTLITKYLHVNPLAPKEAQAAEPSMFARRLAQDTTHKTDTTKRDTTKRDTTKHDTTKKSAPGKPLVQSESVMVMINSILRRSRGMRFHRARSFRRPPRPT